MINTRSEPRSKGRLETLGTNGKEVSWSLRWLNTVLVVCEYKLSHLPNHGKRTVAAHTLKLGQ